MDKMASNGKREDGTAADPAFLESPMVKIWGYIAALLLVFNDWNEESKRSGWTTSEKLLSGVLVFVSFVLVFYLIKIALRYFMRKNLLRRPSPSTE